MPLPLPTLDDRTYEQLLDEVRERLPAAAPEWTDYNASDPGITLLELFAYLSEVLLYRFDRIPESQQRAFLRLIGCAPRLAQAAQAVVAFRASGAAGAVDLPPRVQVANSAGDIVFQTGTPFFVTGAQLKAMITATGGRFEDHGETIAAADAPFHAFGKNPQPGDALYFGFDQPLGAEGARLRLFVVGEDPAADLRTWQMLREEWRNEATRFRNSCPRMPGGTARFWRHYGVRATWEYRSGQDWKALPSLKDFTRGLSLSGPVRWRAPAAHTPGGIAGYDALYFIRCRLIEGAYDCAPRIRGAIVNAVIARHAADIADPFCLGTSTGRADQRFRLPQAPVVPGSTRLRVDVNGLPLLPPWTERSDFDRSGPHAKHYVLDAVTGETAFGDGRGGRVPEAGAELSARWKIGGGTLGNVPAKTLATLREGGTNARIAGWTTTRKALAVEQPIDACGGADAESIDATKARAYRMIAEQRCAVTLEDLERTARAVPGVPVARARAIAEFHPKMSCLPVAGCATIVIVPRCVESKPNPTDAMCRAVARFVSHRRPVALEIHVTGPAYTVIKANARLVLTRGAERKNVVEQAEVALRGFLNPLTWPIGRPVYRSEILALLDAIEGVDHVSDLSLTANKNAPDQCGDIAICPNGLVTSGEHVISAV
jgi:hypothetical protein